MTGIGCVNDSGQAFSITPKTKPAIVIIPNMVIKK
jgi:hypothetical protein